MSGSGRTFRRQRRDHNRSPGEGPRYKCAVQRSEGRGRSTQSLSPPCIISASPPTRLAASFVKADRFVHRISVLIDQNREAASQTGPETQDAPGDSYCTPCFRSSRQHGKPAMVTNLACLNSLRAGTCSRMQSLTGIPAVNAVYCFP